MVEGFVSNCRRSDVLHRFDVMGGYLRMFQREIELNFCSLEKRRSNWLSSGAIFITLGIELYL